MSPSCRHALIAFAVILGLLVQAQSVYACTMTGQQGVIEDCCCEDGCPLQTAAEACCEFSVELSMNRADNAAPAAMILSDTVKAKPIPGLPPPMSSWLVVALPHPNPIFLRRHPNADTKTYLSTQRLRI